MAKTTSNGAVDPSAYQKIVGATFAKAVHRPLITIGPRSWDRWALGRLGCPHPGAALRVSRVIQTLGITTVKEFLDRAPEFGRFKTLGVTSYWLVLALAQDCGRDIEATHGDDHSFASIHRRALKSDTPAPRRRRRTRGGV